MEVKRVRAKVIMLPTEDIKGYALYTHHKGYLIEGICRVGEPNGTQQHLYFTTDEEIKEGDWYIDDCNLIRQAVTSDKDYWDRRPTYKKIVATTDTSLELPEPSQAFIEKYVKLGGIDEIDLEYEADLTTITKLDSGLQQWEYKLKVDPVHNTVTIHAIKDSWSREEVIKLLQAHGIASFQQGVDTTLKGGVSRGDYTTVQFIEENL